MRRTLLRRLVLALLAMGAVVAVWTVLVLLSIRGDLTEARQSLEEGRSSGDVDVAEAALASAEEQLDRSVSRLGQPGPAIAAAFPVIGRPVRAVDRTAEAALAVVRATGDVLAVTRTDQLLLPGGGVDLAVMDEVEQALRQAAQQTREPVAALSRTRTGLVPSQVAGPVHEAQEQLAEVPDAFVRAAAGVRGVSQLLGSERPRRLLVLLQNNAEQRGAGGVVTVFAEASAQDGRLEIESFRDVEDVAAPPETAEPVGAPDDYRDLWGQFLANTTLWKNANMTPDLPTASLVLSRIASVSLENPPDAVVWFDVPAIAGILGATGPATLPDGSSLTAENAVPTLLSTAYAEAEDTREGQAARRAALRGAADAVLGRVFSRGEGAAPSLGKLATALADAAGGRHLALWSQDAEEQSDLLRAGLAGEVVAGQGDLSSFAVQNLGGGDTDGNKLDYYARRQVRVWAVLEPEQATVVQQVFLRNTAPASGLPVYVAGGGTPGTTNNLVSLAMPAGATLEHFTRGGQDVLVEPRPEGDHTVLTDVVSLPAGTDVTWELRYRMPLPEGRYRTSLLPQPQAFDGELHVEVVAADGYRLSTPPGSELVTGEGGALRLDEPFSVRRDLQVDVVAEPLAGRVLDAVRRFWNEPVGLP